jgi:Sulfotransferase domain
VRRVAVPFVSLFRIDYCVIRWRRFTSPPVYLTPYLYSSHTFTQGTSYTLTNIEHLCNVTTASNYAQDWDAVVPVRPEYSNGPFLHRFDENHRGRLPHNVLTKTHCAGYCDDCGPRGYYLETVDDFAEGCVHATRPKASSPDGHKYDDVHYHATIPVKAVHLFRNPFDNIVARMHLALKMHNSKWTAKQTQMFNNSKEGVSTWCSYLDNKYWTEEEHFFAEPIVTLFRDLPCHGDFYRYAQWHNHSVALTDKLRLPVHYLHYENYTTAYDATVDGLLDFLELHRVQTPLQFSPGHTYLDFFDAASIRAAAALVRAVVNDETWALLQHYFE